VAFELRKAKVLGYLLSVKLGLVSKISNLCDHNPPTSQADKRTDDMRSQDRTLHYSALRGKDYAGVFGVSSLRHDFC